MYCRSSLLTNLDVERSQGQLFKSNIERFVLFRIEHTYEWRLNISYTKIVLTSHPASPVMFNHWYYRDATNHHDKTLNAISKSVWIIYMYIRQVVSWQCINLIYPNTLAEYHSNNIYSIHLWYMHIWTTYATAFIPPNHSETKFRVLVTRVRIRREGGRG